MNKLLKIPYYINNQFQYFSKELNNNKRNFGLDLLRALAILFVIISHSRYYINSSLKTLGYYNIDLDYLSIGGFVGVEVFFTLSGFLIGSILVKKIKSDTLNLIEFWKRRWYRTFPMYFFTVLLVIIVNVIFSKDIPNDLWKFFLFSQNIIEKNAFFAVSWSLTIEEWFYITYPIVLFLTNKFLSKKSWYLSILLFMIAGIIIRYIGYNNGVEISDIRNSLIYRIDSILYGVLFAFLLDQKSLNKKQVYSLSLVAIILLILSLFIIKKTSVLAIFAFPILNFSIGLFIPLLLTFNINNKNIRNFFTIISLISYSLYLLHHDIIWQIIYNTYAPHTVFALIIVIIFYILLTFILSFITYLLIELPFILLRDIELKVLLSKNIK